MTHPAMLAATAPLRAALPLAALGLAPLACAPSPADAPPADTPAADAPSPDAPPLEEGDFLPTDLVELIEIDPRLELDIRYATTNNFVGSVFYEEARAFLQRPVAEALRDVHDELREQGYGLLIFDGYRPWYVTKLFWDATPDSLRMFVADPAQGSRHNRGAAVDLTLIDLATGRPVDMPSDYDEFAESAYPDYTGGTEEQRRHRDLLRAAMEAHGFRVYETEWWHFDHESWPGYRINNLRFSELGVGG